MTHTTSQTALDDKSLLLSIDFSRFGTQRKLRDDQYDVQAKKDYTAASKKLLQSKTLEAIRNHDNGTRRWIESKTLPSLLKAGIYRVPTALLGEVIAFLQQRLTERSALVEAFREQYAADVAKARAELGPLFSANDYPDADAAIGEFDMTWRFVASGVPENLKAVDPAAYADEQIKYHSHLVQAQQAYTALLRVAMADLVDHLVEMLKPLPDGRKRRVFAAGFENLGEFIKDFPSRNVADDAELATLVTQAEKMLSGVVIEDVRDDEGARQHVLKQVETIKSTLSTMVTDEDRTIGKRRIKLVDAAA